MYKGLGLDLCEVSRMEKMLKDGRFMNRYFTAQEAAYVQSRGAGAARTLAGLFASREALGKALGGGIDFELKEAEICHTEAGAPFFSFSGKQKERIGSDRVFLSVSHDGGMAAAVCLVEAAGCGPEGE